MKEEESPVKEQMDPVLKKEEEGTFMKKEEHTATEKTPVKLKLDFASLPPPPPPPPPDEPE